MNNLKRFHLRAHTLIGKGIISSGDAITLYELKFGESQGHKENESLEDPVLWDPRS